MYIRKLLLFACTLYTSLYCNFMKNLIIMEKQKKLKLPVAKFFIICETNVIFYFAVILFFHERNFTVGNNLPVCKYILVLDIFMCHCVHFITQTVIDFKPVIAVFGISVILHSYHNFIKASEVKIQI